MPYKLEYWAFQTLAMLITAFLIPGLTVSGPLSALVTVLTLSLVNTYLWDAALFFAIPYDLSLHTLALFVINGVLFWVIVKILPGIAVKGIIPALVAPVMFTVISILIQHYGPHIDWQHMLVTIKAFMSQVQGYLGSTQSEQHSFQNSFLFASIRA